MIDRIGGHKMFHSAAYRSCIEARPGIKPSMLGRAAQLGGTNRAQAAQLAAQPNRAEPERQGYATEQAEPSMHSD